MTTVLSAHPAFVLPLSLGGVNPPTVPPFRDRGQIRWAVNFEPISTYTVFGMRRLCLPPGPSGFDRYDGD
jgi:hypothetical protein